MSTLVNRQLLLKTRPEGRVGREHFSFVETPVPALADGELLVRVLYLSMDPTNRVWMSDIPQYLPPVAAKFAEFRQRVGVDHGRISIGVQSGVMR